NVLDAKVEYRPNSYAVPWKAFVPDLIVTLTTPAAARPYSAVKLLVKTVISCTASKGTVCPTDAVNSSLLAAPSSKMFVLADRRPLILKPAPRGVRPASAALLTLPTVPTKSYGLRVSSGRSLSSFDVSSSPTVCVSAFNDTADSLTSTVSVTFPN